MVKSIIRSRHQKLKLPLKNVCFLFLNFFNTLQFVLYIPPLRHGRMHKWLNLDSTCEANCEVGESRWWLRDFVLVNCKGVIDLRRKWDLHLTRYSNITKKGHSDFQSWRLWGHLLLVGCIMSHLGDSCTNHRILDVPLDDQDLSPKQWQSYLPTYGSQCYIDTILIS